MSNSAWGALHFSNRGRSYGRGYGQVTTLQPFPTGDEPLLVPQETDVEIDLVVTNGDDEFIDLHTPGTGEREDEELLIGTTPGAVPVRVGNWDLDAEPFATYRIASGDTLSGLAITYLGDGTRWREIYETGGNQAKFPNPNLLDSIGPLDMPEEARDRMNAFLTKGQPPGTTPGEIKPSEVKKIKDRPKFVVAAVVGVVAAVAVAVVVYNVAT